MVFLKLKSNDFFLHTNRTRNHKWFCTLQQPQHIRRWRVKNWYQTGMITRKYLIFEFFYLWKKKTKRTSQHYIRCGTDNLLFFFLRHLTPFFFRQYNMSEHLVISIGFDLQNKKRKEKKNGLLANIMTVNFM